MLSETPKTERVVLPVDLTQAQRLVGVRYILLAPLHDLRLTRVIVEEAGAAPLAHVSALSGSREEEIELTALRARLREGVRLELANVRDRPFQLDMALLDKVEAAADRQAWEEIIQLIGGWPGPLSLLLRTPVGAALDAAEKARIGHGLGLLATAYRTTGRSAWAEELFRLGLQFVSDGTHGAELFAALGQTMVGDGRFGEAIGPLRRALALGASPRTVGVPLGRAFLRRGRAVAAVAALEAAREAGVADGDVYPLLRRARDVLGDRAGAWCARHPKWTSEAALKDVEPAVEDDGIDEIDDDDDAEVTSRVAEPSVAADGGTAKDR
jgi:hypothetical protein